MKYLIIDTNIQEAFCGPVSNRSVDYYYTIEAINKRKLIVLYDDNLLREYSKRFREMIIAWDQAGAARKANSKLYNSQVLALKKHKALTCNDCHILVAAIHNRVRLLCSNDSALIDDFKKKEFLHSPRGLVIPRQALRREVMSAIRKGYGGR